MKRKICVVTGSRAEYGLLRWVMSEIKNSRALELQVVVTGMHLSPVFGNTYKEIENDGFNIDCKVDMLLGSNTEVGLTKSMGVSLIGFADALSQLKPDIMLVLGDRYEIFSAVSAAMIACVPVAHLHGGELTEGAFDDAIRHSITKMSHLHFVAAEEYKNRVIQLGEQPDRVYEVGALGLDSLNNIDLLDREALEKELGFRFNKKNILVTYHPVTLDPSATTIQMAELLSVLENLKDTNIIFTMPNADTNSQQLVSLINSFVSSHQNAYVYKSLGQQKYLSCLKYIDAVVGNSSSGLIEAPSFNIGTINIGDRQKGRLKAESVIDCKPTRESFKLAFNKLYSDSFQMKLKSVINPYGSAGASSSIVKILSEVTLDGIVKKQFYNVI